MKKIQSIQAARGLAALGVLGFHAQSVDNKYLPRPFLPEFFSFGQTGLDLFFVVSGFVMAIVARKFRGVRDIAPFISQRALRIYPTYWIYFLALAAVYFIAPGIFNRSQSGQVDLLRSFLLLPSDVLPLLIVAWSLTLELWFYVLFAILMLAPAKSLPYALMTWLAIILWCSAFEDAPADVFLRVMMHPFAVEFILGALAGLLWRARSTSKLKGVGGSVLSMTGVAIVVMTYTFGIPDGSDVIATTSTARVIFFGVGYSLLLVGMAILEREGMRIWKPLVALGDASFTLYLSHIIVLNLYARIWFFSPLTSFDDGLGAGVFWTLTLTSSVVYAMVAYRLTEGPLLQFLRSRLRSDASGGTVSG